MIHEADDRDLADNDRHSRRAPELTEKTFLGLTAWYSDEELAFMAKLRAGLPETKNEMITFHELKAMLGAMMIDEPPLDTIDP